MPTWTTSVNSERNAMRLTPDQTQAIRVRIRGWNAVACVLDPLLDASRLTGLGWRTDMPLAEGVAKVHMYLRRIGK